MAGIFKPKDIHIEAIFFDGSEESANEIVEFTPAIRHNFNSGNLLLIFPDEEMFIINPGSYIAKIDEEIYIDISKIAFESIFFQPTMDHN